MKRLLVATTNPGKQREFRRLLDAVPADVVTPGDVELDDLDVEEPYATYAENAIAKADAYARASRLPTLADDSGIEAAALGWGPGVLSARWAGDRGEEAGRMLEALHGVQDRAARMVCVLALVIPTGERDPVIETFTGVMEGSIATSRRGSGGFGYDPIFLVDRRTTAELPEAEKDRISHRGRAVAAAMPRLLELYPD